MKRKLYIALTLAVLLLVSLTLVACGNGTPVERFITAQLEEGVSRVAVGESVTFEVKNHRDVAFDITQFTAQAQRGDEFVLIEGNTITAVAPTAAETITVSANIGGQTYSATITVAVYQKGIEATASASSVKEGETIQLSVVDHDGNPIENFSATAAKGNKFVTIEAGVVTGVKNVDAEVITVLAEIDGVVYSDTITVAVTAGARSITASSSTNMIEIGQTASISVVDQDGNSVENFTATATNGDAYVTILNGVITGVSATNAEIITVKAFVDGVECSSQVVIAVAEAQANEMIFYAGNYEAKSYDTNVVGDFTIYATSSKTVSIDRNAKSVDGFNFAYRLKLGGTGVVGETGNRCVGFTLTQRSTIVIYAMSSSSGSDRTLAISNGTTDVATVIAKGATLEAQSVELDAGTYYIYSISSGINIYAMYIGNDLENADFVGIGNLTQNEVVAISENETLNVTDIEESNITSNGTFGNFVFNAKGQYDTGANVAIIYSNQTYQDTSYIWRLELGAANVDDGGVLEDSYRTLSFTTGVDNMSIKVLAGKSAEGEVFISLYDANGALVGAQQAVNGEITEHVFTAATAGEYFLAFTAPAAYIYKVDVEEIKEIDHIEVTTAPTKTAYQVGQAFDPEGMVVTVFFTDNSSRVLESDEFTCSGQSLILTDTVVTITLVENSDFTTTQAITVTDTKTIKAIEITTPPTKTTYFVGETFNATGMVVSIVYEDDSKEVTEEFSFSQTALAIGTESITITLDADQTKTVECAIVVEEIPDGMFSLNVSDFVHPSGDKTRLTEVTAIGLFTVIVNSEKYIDIEGNNKSVDNYEFTQRLKLNGSGVPGEASNDGYRSVKFTLSKTSKVKIYIMSGSSSSDRQFGISDGTSDVAVGTALGTELKGFEFTLGAGTYYVYSKESGINLYAIFVQPEGESQKTITSISVTTPPTKTTYVAGETFDATGMVVTATYSDQSTGVITNIAFSQDQLTEGQTQITIALDGNSEISTTVAITVTAAQQGGVEFGFNMSDYTLETSIESSIEWNGFTFIGTSDKKISVDSTSKTVDEIEFTKRLKLGGSGVPGDDGYRTIKFVLTAPSTVTIYAASSSDGTDRSLTITDGTNDISSPALGGVFVGVTHYLPAGTYFIYSPSSGVNILGIFVDDTLPASISVKTAPDKTTYSAGEIFDATGMVVELVFANGKKMVTTDYTVSTDALTANATQVEIVYSKDNTIKTTQTITIATKTVVSIAVTTQPTKTSYTVGEVFDATGMVVTAYYADQTSEVITDYEFSQLPLAADQVEVVITHGTNDQITTTVAITVAVPDTFGLNFSDYQHASGNKTTLEATTVMGQITIIATSGKTVQIDGNNKSLDGYEFSQRLKLGGEGVVGDEGYRTIKIVLTKKSVVNVYAMSSSSGSDRELAVSNGTADVLSYMALGTSLSNLSYELEAGTYYFYSKDGGINIYAIFVAPVGDSQG